jgi:CRISPR-associated protein Csm3
VGSGKPEIEIGEVDMPILRDTRDQPYIPGSSIKGKIRAEAERIARKENMEVCSPPNVKNMCGTIKANRNIEDYCICCRIFGTAGEVSVASKVSLEMPIQLAKLRKLSYERELR